MGFCDFSHMHDFFDYTGPVEDCSQSDVSSEVHRDLLIRNSYVDETVSGCGFSGGFSRF